MSPRRLLAALGASALLVTGVAACGSSSNDSTSSSSTGSTASASGPVTGAGSTFIAPIMSKWQPDYSKQTGDAVTYGAIGSGGGIEQITGRTVDFGASDAPLTADQLKAAKDVVQIPWILGAVVPAYKLDGAPKDLHLTGQILADMYLGKVKSWDDPAIAKLNPGVNLPATKVTPVYRSDASGDTYAYTDYMSAVSPEFKSKVGVGTQVQFPTGTGAEGSDGVGAAISATDGAVGSLTIAYVDSNDFAYARLENAAGKFPDASVDAINAAAASVKSVPATGVSLVDPPASAPDAWPDSTFSYAIVPTDSPKADALKSFINYVLTDGQAFTADLGYGTLPKSVAADDKKLVDQIGG